MRGPPLITHLFVAVDETEEVFNQMISNIRSNKDTNLKTADISLNITEEKSLIFDNITLDNLLGRAVFSP